MVALVKGLSTTVGVALEKWPECKVLSMASAWSSTTPGMRKGGYRKFRTPSDSDALIASYMSLGSLNAFEDYWNAWSAAWPYVTLL